MADSETIPTVTPEELEALRTQPAVTIIDVRMPFVYLGGRIPNAVNMPGKAFIARRAQVPTELKLVFVDDDGTDTEAAESAAAAGYSDVSVLAGGYDAWVEADLPTETASEGVMPAIATPTKA